MNAFDLPVIPFAIIVSLCLVFTFVLFFLRDQARPLRDAARESLLPLNEETPRVTHAASHEPAHDHPHDDGCGCRSGKRAPCPGCLKRTASL